MIIHAVSIHSGGGKVLLDQILTVNNLNGDGISILICDERYEIPANSPFGLQIHKVKPNLLSRWKAEFLLKSIALENPRENVLCFSNLPPALKLPNKVILFLQNALLFPGIPLHVDSIKTKLRIMYEKLWLNFFMSNVNEFWVQTAWMKDILEEKTAVSIKIKPIILDLPTPTKRQKKYNYITVSGSTPHKRLYELLKAWELIDNPPKLLVIMDQPSSKIKAQIERVQNRNITFVINAKREDIYTYYEESKILLITSKIESYCLPIYEALHFGLRVIAPNEGYTHEVINQIEIIEDFSVSNLIKKIQTESP